MAPFTACGDATSHRSLLTLLEPLFSLQVVNVTLHCNAELGYHDLLLLEYVVQLKFEDI
jgi:hypothetical protein